MRDEKYGIAGNQLNTMLSVDGAASPFIAQLKHLKKTSKHKAMWKFINIKPFTLKKKDTNLGIIKNAFAFKVLTILNEGMYNWDKSINKHRLEKKLINTENLMRQLKTVLWNLA